MCETRGNQGASIQTFLCVHQNLLKTKYHGYKHLVTYVNFFVNCGLFFNLPIFHFINEDSASNKFKFLLPVKII